MNWQGASRIRILLKSKWAVRWALYSQGKCTLREALSRTGPDFQESETAQFSYAVGHSTVNVQCHTEAGMVEYIYCLHNVERIAIEY